MKKNLLLNIKNLTISFKKNHKISKVVDDLNLSLNAGETLALVGSSGSGKTLTALSILQLLPEGALISPHSEILLSEIDLLNQSQITMKKILKNEIGMIFQEASAAFNPVMTIGNQIASALSTSSSSKKLSKKARIFELLRKVGIPDPERVAVSYPHMLSGGMRQRAMIAMALASEPKLLIADEPTTALDVTLQAQILQLLSEIQKKHHIGLLFITHDLAVAKQIAHKIAIVSKGKIVECNETQALFHHPIHEYTKKLFSAFPAWEKRRDNTSEPQQEKGKLLTVENLKIYFQTQKTLFYQKKNMIKAVDNIDFFIRENETFALVGESGSGKTTTAKGILNLIHHDSGNIYFEENLLNKSTIKLLRKDIQMVFQDPVTSMNPRMRVGEILSEGAKAQATFKTKKILEQKINELLHQVGLDERCKTRYPHEFSGGQRQRICIARALVMQPKLIICDEPTSALDVITQMDILNLLKDLQEKLGISYLLITHNISIVAYLAHRVAVMHHGKIVEQGEVSDILFNPQQAYTKKLLSSAPTIE